MTRNQSGFTLIEIAIVLVIIGLLLGAVLKGQEMIENGKVRNAVNDMNSVVAARLAYVERYRRQPGDDGPLATVTARGGQWAVVTQGGDNDGVYDITQAQTFTGAGENDNFWQHLRAAGLLTGSPADAGAAAQPRNAFGGLIGITQTGVTGMVGGPAVCMGSVPGKHAQALDTQLDDGVPNTGTVQATQGANNAQPAAAAATYTEDQVYTVCRTI